MQKLFLPWHSQMKNKIQPNVKKNTSTEPLSINKDLLRVALRGPILLQWTDSLFAITLCGTGAFLSRDRTSFIVDVDDACGFIAWNPHFLHPYNYGIWPPDTIHVLCPVCLNWNCPPALLTTTVSLCLHGGTETKWPLARYIDPAGWTL